jgi:hypothetical protein
MKRSVLAILVVGVLASVVRAESLWSTSGVLINPATDAIVCDSGALPAAPDGGQATTGVRVIFASTAAALVQIEHRNADNTANVTTSRAPNGEAQAFSVPANQQIDVRDFLVIISPNDRVRVRLLAGVTGRLQCTIWTDQ